MKDAYGFAGDYISWQDWADLTVRMETDSDLFNKFTLYRYKVPVRGFFGGAQMFVNFCDSTVTYSGCHLQEAPHSPCTGSCQQNTVCELRTGRFGDSATFCADVTEEQVLFMTSFLFTRAKLTIAHL